MIQAQMTAKLPELGKQGTFHSGSRNGARSDRQAGAT